MDGSPAHHADPLQRSIPPQARQALDDLAEGRIILLIDDAGGDCGAMVALAARMSAANVTTMAVHARGLVCIVLGEGAVLQRGFALQQGSRFDAKTASLQLVSIEAADCDGTGISAHDRAQTIRAAGRPDAAPADFRSPGHVFPVVVRTDQHFPASLPQWAEALVRQVSGTMVAAYCDVLDEEGELASAEDCAALAAALGLACLRVHDCAWLEVAAK